MVQNSSKNLIFFSTEDQFGCWKKQEGTTKNKRLQHPSVLGWWECCSISGVPRRGVLPRGIAIHLLRVSVRRQVACYVTERRTGGNTTDEFNPHTTYALNLQNSVAYPQQ